MPKVTIEDFTNLVEIGKGAFGTVFKATHIKSKRIFALKRMHKAYLEKQNMISQINTEISISTNLKHDNIIKVYDCFEDQDYLYLVLELAENGQLYDKLKRVGRFDENTVKTMIKDVVAAVEYLHSRDPPIIHRDIKPENLLLDRNNKVKLADFGWSTVLSKPRKTYCGTVDYLAPEMIDKTGHDQKLDIWCIGVLVYELLTGRTPFVSGKNEPANVVHENIRNVRIQFPEEFPTLAKQFVMGMIKRNPKERMGFSEIKQHPWFKQKMQVPQKLPKPTNTNNRIKVEENVEKIQSTIDNSKIIRELNNRIRELQQQNLNYKIRIQQLQKGTQASSTAGDSTEVARLMNEVRRLKVAEEMNERYKKKQEKMWEQINQKEKEIIKMKTDLKRVEDLKSQVQRLQSDKQKLGSKVKTLQKQLQTYEQKNRQLQDKLKQVNSQFTQRVKNGQKLRKQQIQSPEFITFLRDQIQQMTQKFEQSKEVVSKMLEKQNKQKKLLEELSKYRSQEKSLRQIVKAQIRQQYEKQKDELLMKVQKQLTEQREKFYKEREQLKALYQDGNGSSTEASSAKGSLQQDLEGELRNVRELNSYYEKQLNQQKHEIQDLKQELKRKR